MICFHAEFPRCLEALNLQRFFSHNQTLPYPLSTSTTMFSSARRLLMQHQLTASSWGRTTTAGRSLLVSRHQSLPPKLMLAPSKAVQTFTTIANSSGGRGGFFNRTDKKLLFKRGVIGTAIGLGGYTAYAMQRDKAAWQETAMVYGRLKHDASIVEDLRYLRGDWKDFTWYEIGLRYFTFWRDLLSTERDHKAYLLEQKELTFPELQERMKQDNVVAVKITMYIGTGLAEVQCKTRGDESDALKYYIKTGHIEIDESGWGLCHSSDIWSKLPVTEDLGYETATSMSHSRSSLTNEVEAVSFSFLYYRTSD